MISVTKIVWFAAAHYLPKHDGACQDLHGHTWKVEIEVGGDILDTGMVIDFSDLKKLIQREVLDHVDHKCLNDTGFHILKDPTAENLCRWVQSQINVRLPEEVEVVRVRVWESRDSYAEWKL
jgi:6-pyruvoyltetrahydropterin/6-carboxytetrahydropterin synthase